MTNPIRIYEMRRRSGETWGPNTTVELCERHVAARKILGWVVSKRRKSLSPVPSCEDCTTVKRQPTVMDRLIEAGDEPTPTPVPVLKGQRRMF
jgi:hypothetical protein